jgi:hypothetical protein
MAATTRVSPQVGSPVTAERARPAPMPPELKAAICRLLAQALVADVQAERAARQQDEDDQP